MSRQWFVKKQDRVYGPFSRDRIRILAATGELERDQFVSHDQKSWIPAGRIKGLTFADVQTTTPNAPEIPELEERKVFTKAGYRYTKTKPTKLIWIASTTLIATAGIIVLIVSIWGNENLPETSTANSEKNPRVSAETVSPEDAPAENTPEKQSTEAPQKLAIAIESTPRVPADLKPGSIPAVDPSSLTTSQPAETEATETTNVADRSEREETAKRDNQENDTTAENEQVAERDPEEYTTSDLSWLIGKDRTVALMSGSLWEADVVSARVDVEKNTLESLTLRKKGFQSTKTFRGRDIRSVYTPEVTMNIYWNTKTRQAEITRIQSKAKAREQAQAYNQSRQQEESRKLAALGHVKWTTETPAEQREIVTAQKVLLKEIGSKYSNNTLSLHETVYFLFYTDIPSTQVSGYIRQLDSMYFELQRMFGLSINANTWRGKCVIIAFLKQSDYENFERDFMKNSNTKGTQAIFHGYKTGNVIISCHLGDDPLFFASTLVHETTHGYLHRYKTSVPVPGWINEGIAEVVAAKIVPNCSVPQDRQYQAIARLRQNGTTGSFLTNLQISSWQYGLASDLVEYMNSVGIGGTPDQGFTFRRFIEDIKDGKSWEDSLQKNYFMSKEQLLINYGNTIGVRNLVN